MRCAALLLPACEVPSLSPVPGTSSPAPLPFSHTYSSLHPSAAAAPLLAPPLRPYALFPSLLTARITTTYISSAAATSHSRSCGCRNRAVYPRSSSCTGISCCPADVCQQAHTHTHNPRRKPVTSPPTTSTHASTYHLPLPAKHPLVAFLSVRQLVFCDNHRPSAAAPVADLASAGGTLALCSLPSR